jgi:DNA repair exonuclease SbcCD ATPase subunit
VARQAGERAVLEQRWQRRIDLEAQVQAAEAALVAVAADIAAVAPECGVAAGSAEAAVTGLAAWQEERGVRLSALDAARQDWDRLQQALGESTLGTLEADASGLRVTADGLAAGLDPVELEAFTPDELSATHAEQLAATVARLAQQRTRIETSLGSDLRDAPSVAEAEEALDAARRERSRLDRLKDTLERTEKFLQSAQERVHREFAPRLQAEINGPLAAVTGGRYREVFVDPQDLNVRVRTPDQGLREARLLSHGTAEQVYLLLRVAMAEQLTTPGERCPLLLDDITVQSDAVRSRTILETLHGISARTQVILFTQEDDVLAWARDHLAGPGDRLQVLPPVG